MLENYSVTERNSFFTKGEAALLLVKRPGDCKWRSSWPVMYPLDNPADLATKLRINSWKKKKKPFIFCFQSVFKDFSNSECCSTTNGASCSPLVVGAWQAAALLLCWAEQRQTEGKIRKTIICHAGRSEDEQGRGWKTKENLGSSSFAGTGITGSCLPVHPQGKQMEIALALLTRQEGWRCSRRRCRLACPHQVSKGGLSAGSHWKHQREMLFFPFPEQARQTRPCACDGSFRAALAWLNVASPALPALSRQSQPAGSGAGAAGSLQHVPEAALQQVELHPSLCQATSFCSTALVFPGLMFQPFHSLSGQAALWSGWVMSQFAQC